MRGRSWFSVPLIAATALLMSFGLTCAVHQKLTTTSVISDPHVRKPVRRLVSANPGQFSKPFTLLVFTDETATCGMREARWWRDWASFMNEHGWGFVLATSKEDSLDLVIAAQMDSVRAPTLIVPSCKHYLAELGVPLVPLNVLVDSTAEVRYAWSAPLDTTESRRLLVTLDSMISLGMPAVVR